MTKDVILVVGSVFLIGLIQIGWYYNESRMASVIENEIYLWTRGEIYCTHCKKNEKIKSVAVRDLVKASDGKTIRSVSVRTEKHFEDANPFEAVATIGDGHLREFYVDPYPGDM